MQKTLNSEFFPRYSSGSVVAEVELKFERSVLDPLKPLEDEIKDGKLGSFTVSRELDLNPSKACATWQLDSIFPFLHEKLQTYLITLYCLQISYYQN